MLTTRIGLEPEHQITINPGHVMYIKPNGVKGVWTWVHLVSGEKLLVDETYDAMVATLDKWEARHAHNS